MGEIKRTWKPLHYLGFGNRFGFGGLKVWKLVPESIGRGCGIESDGLHRDVYTYVCIHIHTQIDTYIHIYIYTHVYMAVNQNRILSRAPPPPHPLLHTPLSRHVVTYLCRECLAQVCPTKEPCRKGACRTPGDSVTNLCLGMATQACYKPRVFLIHSHVYR